MADVSGFAVLLTGGASRRMGTAKALVEVDGITMVKRVEAALAQCFSDIVEVGPGYSNFRFIVEDPPGEGPLAGLVAGWRALDCPDFVTVLAVDMPFVSAELLCTLRDAPGANSVIPVAVDRQQPLCARWSAQALQEATQLLKQGARSMKSLLEVVPHDSLRWEHVHDLRDIDAPSDLRW
jgi:molybdopterin-guanine dinucleotide biosynthesis protein A